MEEENGKLAESETTNPPETAPVLPPRLPDAPEVPISRWKKWGADSVKAMLALLMLALGVAVWWQPPLVAAKSPSVSYTFQGKVFRDAELYAPLSVPTRYYIRLPHELARRYCWFAVDRRREVAALTKEPERRIFGHYAIRRGDPLGQDLEFTKIDGLEWRVGFYADSVVFSNAILCVRLEK